MNAERWNAERPNYNLPITDYNKPIAAIVLAAGLSSRYGNGVNKLLLPFADGTVLRHVLNTVIAAQVDHVVVVTGHMRGQVEAALLNMPATFVHNPRYAEGEMVSSTQAGLRHLESTSAQAAMIVLGDQPLMPASILRRLMQAYRNGCGSILAPMFNGTRGHPVLLDRQWWPAALALPDGAPMRQLLKAHPAHVVHLLVNTDVVLKDVDTPALYDEALETLER
jgi:molybdenum cofactor cytidylyltransferase